jgi:hypothetical protein
MPTHEKKIQASGIRHHQESGIRNQASGSGFRLPSRLQGCQTAYFTSQPAVIPTTLIFMMIVFFKAKKENTLVPNAVENLKNIEPLHLEHEIKR